MGWGTYAYDVKGVIKDENKISAIRNEPTLSGGEYSSIIAAMGLLVIYERDDLPLTTYWINEGADVIWASNETGLTPNDCITKASFTGTVPDLDKANATLRTIVPFGDKGDDDKNRLSFNGEKWHGVWHGSITWPPGRNKRYVTDYLKSSDNEAGLQDKGDWMVPSNAFLIVTYPPDLEPSLERAPKEVAIGNSYDIPVVIKNVGKSKAKNFNVSFSATGGEPRERKKHVEVVEGDGGSTTEYFSWTAPSTPGTVEFKVEVDADNDVEELINKQHPYGESNNNVTKTVTVGLGELIPQKHPGGGGGGTGGGWGEGTGTDEGAGEGTGTGGAGGEGAVGETGGKAITGYLMKGSAVSGEEGGGGGKGEFSLVALLMRLMMLAAAVVLVCVGYLMERRRQNNKQ